MPIINHHQVNTPTAETRIEVEDDRTIGEKAKDAVSNAAHTVKEAFTHEDKNKHAAKAAEKQNAIEKEGILKFAEKAEKVDHQKEDKQHAEKCRHAVKHSSPEPFVQEHPWNYGQIHDDVTSSHHKQENH